MTFYELFLKAVNESGEVSDLYTIEVHEGEYLGRNPDGSPIMYFKYQPEKQSANRIGFYGHLKLNNGRELSVYYSDNEAKDMVQKFCTHISTDKSYVAAVKRIIVRKLIADSGVYYASTKSGRLLAKYNAKLDEQLRRRFLNGSER